MYFRKYKCVGIPHEAAPIALAVVGGSQDEGDDDGDGVTISELSDDTKNTAPTTGVWVLPFISLIIKAIGGGLPPFFGSKMILY